MLWQPALPESYRRLLPDELGARIDARRRELGDALVILGHHYQTDQVIRHADFRGDSLKLSQIAATLASERPVDRPVRWVVFCGVHFMAETADVLTPDDVAVILPDLSAGCSMADMAQYDETVEAWNAIHGALAERRWRGRIVPVTYVNSSAAIKAFVGDRGGACCTSSNARSVLAWAMAGGTRAAGPGEEIKVLFLPDQHLGRNTAAAMGVDVATESCVYDPRLARRGDSLGGATVDQLVDSRVILWAGHCSVHKLFRPEHCDQIRAMNAADAAAGNPREPMRILVHPECCKEVVDKADLAGSTEYIISQVERSKPGARWAIGTEFHLVNRLSRQAAARDVEVRILSECQCLCTTMYRIDEPHLLWVLDNLAGASSDDRAPRVVNQIRVNAEARRLALLSLDRMLSLSRSGPSPQPVGSTDSRGAEAPATVIDSVD